MKVLFIAPFSPAGCKVPALGAAKKISLLVQALAGNGHEVAFLNTANNVPGGKIPGREQWFPEGVRDRLFLPVFAPRAAGRFIFILVAWLYGLWLGVHRRPDVIWIYNEGAGEMLAGVSASVFGGIVINEIEDLPDARPRGAFNLKPKLDRFAARILRGRVDRFMFVSDEVGKYFEGMGITGRVVNGLIPSLSAGNRREPGRVGYFGGLAPEKGGGIILSLMRSPSRTFPVSVCGSGDLLPEITGSVNALLGDIVLSNVPDQQVADEMDRCSVLLNPHLELAHMSGGVFPFKLVEYLNSGAWIVSTDMMFPEVWTAELGVSVVARDAAVFEEAVSAVLGRGGIPDAIRNRRRTFLGQFVASAVVAGFTGNLNPDAPGSPAGHDCAAL